MKTSEITNEEILAVAHRTITAIGISMSSFSIVRRKLFRVTIYERAAMEALEQLRFEAAIKGSFRMQIAIASAWGNMDLLEREMRANEVGHVRVRILAMAQEEMERIGIPRNWNSVRTSLSIL